MRRGLSWQHLRTRPTLSQFAECHRGIEWKKYDDQVCHAATPRKGYRRGYLNVDGQMLSFQPIRPVYLNVDPANLLWSAIDWPWEQPHVVVNAARNSRGAWRVTGFVDRSGNLCTQRFIGVWPTTPTVSVEVLTAVLNGPVANAFVMASERGRDNRIRTLDALPMPNLTAEAAAQISALVREYEQSAGSAGTGSEAARSLRPILLEIDAIVLGGYALPPRLERSVLEYFLDQERPVPFDFSSYEIESFAAVRAVGGGAGVTDRLADARKRRTALAGRLIDGTITPAEDDELAALDRSLDRYVDTVSPLPFDVLERLEGEARRRGVLTGVQCQKCGTSHDGGYMIPDKGGFKTPEEAVADWNDRTPTPPAWQPIETVPKDGKLVILGAWRTPPWIGWFQSEDFYRWYMANRPFPPTHWMPCPDYPPRGSK